jgi:copper(I)-binding protein
VLLSATSKPSSQAALMQETDSGADAGTMTNIDGGLDIPAKGAVDLGPGGYHLMLTDPASPLLAGGSVALTLRFEHAGTVTFKVPVTSLLSDALTSPATSASTGMANMPGM